MFLASDALATTLADFPDVIRLALFGHTHMDEFRVYHHRRDRRTIPVKLVPSITPVNGNNPAFTLAEIDPPPPPSRTTPSTPPATRPASTPPGPRSTASPPPTIFPTSPAPRSTNSPPPSSTTNPAAPTPATPTSNSSSSATPAQQGHQGQHERGRHAVVWPAYACAITHADAASFRTCACPASPEPLPRSSEIARHSTRVPSPDLGPGRVNDDLHASAVIAPTI